MGRVEGIPANWFAFPLLILVAIMHIAIIILIIDVNNSSNRLSELMQSSGEYQIEATELQASTTVRSETCNNYIQMPVTPNGESNHGPLVTFAKELSAERRGPKVVERFKSYNVSDEVLAYITMASEASEKMTEIQKHAISVMSSVYPTPPMTELASLSNVSLTAEELAMQPEERADYAKRLILNKDYALLRYNVSENIGNCNKTLQREFSNAYAKTKQHVTTVRNLLWAAIIIVISFLVFAFIIFYRLIVKPLRSYTKDIAANKNIHGESGMMEMRQLVRSYNGLWKHRNKLEAVLRLAAENDSLTGLPNRYCLERDIINYESQGGSMAVVMFDVNFLKLTNDTEGHLAGDTLLRTAAYCITECFKTDGANNCYRIGGDEFVAILSNCSDECVKRRLEEFKLALEREGITVSAGYAFTESADGNAFKALIAEADENMYYQKRRIHKKYNNAAESTK